MQHVQVYISLDIIYTCKVVNFKVQSNPVQFIDAQQLQPLGKGEWQCKPSDGRCDV